MPISRESKRKTLLKTDLKSRGHYARRIEDQYGVGILDMIIVPKGMHNTFFMEAKIITGNYFGMTDRQYIEAVKLNKTRNDSAIPVLAGYKESEKKWYLSEPSMRVHLDDCFKQRDGELFEDLLKRWRYTNERE